MLQLEKKNCFPKEVGRFFSKPFHLLFRFILCHGFGYLLLCAQRSTVLLQIFGGSISKLRKSYTGWHGLNCVIPKVKGAQVLKIWRVSIELLSQSKAGESYHNIFSFSSSAQREVFPKFLFSTSSSKEKSVMGMTEYMGQRGSAGRSTMVCWQQRKYFL